MVTADSGLVAAKDAVPFRQTAKSRASDAIRNYPLSVPKVRLYPQLHLRIHRQNGKRRSKAVHRLSWAIEINLAFAFLEFDMPHNRRDSPIPPFMKAAVMFPLLVSVPSAFKVGVLPPLAARTVYFLISGLLTCRIVQRRKNSSL
jgi:hypothetical protein